MTARQYTGDRAFDRLARQVQAIEKRVGGVSGQLGGFQGEIRVIQNVTVSATPTPVETGLNVVRGYWLVRANTGVVLADTGITGGTINLVASGDAIISLAVF